MTGLTTVLLRLVPAELVELPARAMGFVTGVLRPHAAQKAEALVRGRYWGARLGAPGLFVGRHVVFDGTGLSFGRGVRLHSASQYVTSQHGHVRIGDHSHVARMTIISGVGGVTIGDHCAIGPAVTIFSSSTDLDVRPLGSGPAKRASVIIGDGVYIGAGARINPGVRIGDNSVVAAGAVVTSDVPPGHIAKGVPARSSQRTTPALGREAPV